MQPNLREQMLMQGQVDGVFGYVNTIRFSAKLMGVEDKQLRYINYGDYGMDLYSNAIIVSKKLVKEKPEVVRGLVRAINKGVLDTLKDPDASVAAVAKREALIKIPVERERLDATLKDEMNHPEIAKIGLGNVDLARLKKSIDILVDANALPRTPAVEEIFTRRLPAAGRRPAEEAVLGRQKPAEQTTGRQANARRPGQDRETTMDFNLAGRVAVITGPAKGMGAAITKAFAAEGSRLALIGRDTKAIEPVAARGARRGRRGDRGALRSHRCRAMRARGRGDASDAYGRIDILVNVAGGSGPIGKTGVETTPEEFDDIVTLNMNGCFHTMRGVLPTMMAQRYGKIVNVGGTFGMRGRAGRMAYSASKWGLRGITKSFALEVGPYNINVNCVAPGMVDGPRFRDKVCADMAKRLGITVEEAAEKHAGEYALQARDDRRRRRQRLPVSRQRRLAPDHRRRPAGRRRLGDAVRERMLRRRNRSTRSCLSTHAAGSPPPLRGRPARAPGGGSAKRLAPQLPPSPPLPRKGGGSRAESLARSRSIRRSFAERSAA